MILEIIKRELTSLLSWYRGAMFRSTDPSQITKFFGKKLDFQSNAATKKKVKKSEANNTVRYQGNLYNIFDIS